MKIRSLVSIMLLTLLALPLAAGGAAEEAVPSEYQVYEAEDASLPVVCFAFI